MRNTFISIFILLLAVSCNTKSKYRKAADEIAANVPSAKNMNAGKENYHLYVPNGWTTTQRTVYGVDYYFLSAPKTQDDPNTNINVTTEHMQSLSLAEYREKSIESIQKAIPSAELLSRGDISAGDLKGAWYSCYLEPQGIKSKLVCYIFPKNGIAYIITAGTQAKDAARYSSLFDSVAKSMTFVNQ